MKQRQLPPWHWAWQEDTRSSVITSGRISILNCVLAIIATFYLSTQWYQSRHTSLSTRPHLSAADIEYGLDQCALNQLRPVVKNDLASERLSRPNHGVRTILHNATLINGDGKVTRQCNIEMQGSIFTKVSTERIDLRALSSLTDVAIVDLKGRIVTPGLVDMHTHAGVRETPQLWATADITELSEPVTPWGRAVDGFKPHDRAIEIIGSGGVTTSLVLTGASNLISGEGLVIKMKRADSAGDIVVNVTESSPKPMRYLKMAAGENQKRQFEHSATGPTSRLGESYWFRKAYDNARRIKQQQDMWCEAASTKNGQKSLTSEYPQSLEWQTLVDVLRGDVRVNVHAYETEDFMAMLDHADQYGFNITAFHHGLHSDLVAEELKKRDIAIVGFSDSWGDKKELYNVSSSLPKFMADRGVPFVLTRDHPAEHGQWLAYEAQIAHHFGLDTDHAISSIIGEPARLLGLDNRIGFVKPGYDADLVVWDRHPMRVGATPLEVYIDGESVVRASENLWSRSEAPTHAKETPSSRPSETPDNGCRIGQPDVVLVGISKAFVGEKGNQGREVEGHNLTAVIRSGEVVCVGGFECQAAAKKAVEEGVSSIAASNGYLLPGLTVVTRQHGLVEIRQEPSASDGASSGDEFAKPLESRHGVKFGGMHLRRGHQAGITNIVTPPITTGFFHGISCRFRAGARSVIEYGAISEANAALHFTIGHNGKTARTPSITSQISTLRDLLTIDKNIHPIYQQAANGERPVVVHTNNKDVIAHMIALKRETGAHIVIMGGAEAHLLAAELAAINMPVIVAPGWGCEPLFWEGRECLPGPPLTEALGPRVLIDAGVTVGISNWDDTNNHIRNSLWEAGWVAGPGNHSLALDLVSNNIEDILQLERTKDVVLHEGNPFEFGSRVLLSIEEGQVKSCNPGTD